MMAWAFILLQLVVVVEALLQDASFQEDEWRTAREDEFPSIVSVRGIWQQHVCLGVLVDRYHVLTAAHCLNQTGPNPMIYVNVRSTEHRVKRVRAAGATVHPDWDGSYGEAYDAALLRISRPVRRVPTPVLADPTFNLYPNTVVFMLRLGNTLDVAPFDVVKRELCPKMEALGPSAFCAYSRWTSLNEGASGGPVMLIDSDATTAEHLLLVGVISFANFSALEESGTGCVPVSALHGWISEVTDQKAGWSDELDWDTILYGVTKMVSSSLQLVWSMFLAPAQCQYIQPGLTKGENVTTRVWQVPCATQGASRLLLCVCSALLLSWILSQYEWSKSKVISVLQFYRKVHADLYRAMWMTACHLSVELKTEGLENTAALIVAESVLRKGLDILWGMDTHSLEHFAASFSHLADVLEVQGKLEQASRAYGTAVALSESVFGTQHRNVAALWSRWANLKRALDDMPCAKCTCMMAARVQMQDPGPRSPDFAHSLNTFGRIMQCKGYPKLARDAFWIAEEIFAECYGPECAELSEVRHNLEAVSIAVGASRSGRHRIRLH